MIFGMKYKYIILTHTVVYCYKYTCAAYDCFWPQAHISDMMSVIKLWVWCLLCQVHVHAACGRRSHQRPGGDAQRSALPLLSVPHQTQEQHDRPHRPAQRSVTEKKCGGRYFYSIFIVSKCNFFNRMVAVFLFHFFHMILLGT